MNVDYLSQFKFVNYRICRYSYKQEKIVNNKKTMLQKRGLHWKLSQDKGYIHGNDGISFKK